MIKMIESKYYDLDRVMSLCLSFCSFFESNEILVPVSSIGSSIPRFTFLIHSTKENDFGHLIVCGPRLKCQSPGQQILKGVRTQSIIRR